MLKTLSLALALIALIATTSAAFADWAVAQSGDTAPYIQRFRPISWASATTMAQCQAAHDNCKLRATGSSGCLAVSTTGKKWQVVKAGSRPRAIASALKACEALVAGPCRIELEFCGR